ncbi:MAG: voltage-gated potassium channel [Marinobacter maritimus]|jgi:voltage-gated potassium channel
MGSIYLLEFCARLSIRKRRLREIFHALGLADLIVIA